MGNLPTRVALVYDRVNKWGGAEKVLLALNELFPDSPLYTSVYSARSAPWAKVYPKIIPSFLNHIPFVRSRHELIPFLTPIAFESFSFDQYEAVISVTSADAKGIVTNPNTFHLCYCLTPTRYLWSHQAKYQSSLNPVARFLAKPVTSYLKTWDKIASQRPDSYISISKTVQSRVKKYYGLDSFVVFPPVDVAKFSAIDYQLTANDYFLWLGRLVSYKQPDIVVKAFNKLNKKLIVIGTGRMENYLKSIAGTNVEIKGFIGDSEVAHYIQNCRALIYFHDEDFGIVPIEAMAAGKPVIALNQGGVSETVVDKLTGILVDSNTQAALEKAVDTFADQKFDANYIKNYAAKFSKQRFHKEFAKVFRTEWFKYQSKL